MFHEYVISSINNCKCSALCLAHVYLIIVVFQMNRAPAFVFVERMYKKKAHLLDSIVIADMWWCHIFILIKLILI